MVCCSQESRPLTLLSCPRPAPAEGPPSPPCDPSNTPSLAARLEWPRMPTMRPECLVPAGCPWHLALSLALGTRVECLLPKEQKCMQFHKDKSVPPSSSACTWHAKALMQKVHSWHRAWELRFLFPFFCFSRFETGDFGGRGLEGTGEHRVRGETAEGWAGRLGCVPGN